jgi:hypothetical protein
MIGSVYDQASQPSPAVLLLVFLYRLAFKKPTASPMIHSAVTVITAPKRIPQSGGKT